MSGGSYSYLYLKDAGDLMATSAYNDLEAMAARLAELGWAEDAAKDAFDLIAMVRTQRARMEAAQSRLEGVFRAVEWWDSSDGGEDQVRAALAAYRGEGTEEAVDG